MKVTIKTKSGSEYLLNDRTMTWLRQAAGGNVMHTTNHGTLAVWPRISIGESLYMIYITDQDLDRLWFTNTTPIVAMHLEETDGLF